MRNGIYLAVACTAGVFLTCGPNHVGEMLMDAGAFLRDGGERDAHAGPPMEISVTCDKTFEYTVTDSTGTVSRQIHSLAEVDVGDPLDVPDVRVYACWDASPPACPDGSTCSGMLPPAFYGDRCSLTNGGTFVDGKLHIHCGQRYETTPVGGPTEVIYDVSVSDLKVFVL